MMSMWTESRGRARKASTSTEGKALCVPSEARPIDSRRLRAREGSGLGTSLRNRGASL